MYNPASWHLGLRVNLDNPHIHIIGTYLGDPFPPRISEDINCNWWAVFLTLSLARLLAAIHIRKANIHSLKLLVSTGEIRRMCNHHKASALQRVSMQLSSGNSIFSWLQKDTVTSLMSLWYSATVDTHELSLFITCSLHSGDCWGEAPDFTYNSSSVFIGIIFISRYFGIPVQK